jgi:hydroxysqualene synthase
MRTGVDHEENFPVASWLCPPAQRPAVVALYRFARTADDLADEGNLPAAERLRLLALFRHWLNWADGTVSRPESAGHPNWPDLFANLHLHIQQHAWPTAPMHALLDAFEQDVRHTANGYRYKNMADLELYCSRSANPVGRLLLHLFGVTDATSLKQSDDICTALQLINFWQDISIDWPRGRHYLPEDWLAAHGLGLEDFSPTRPAQDPKDASCSAVVAKLFDHAAQKMRTGAPLAWRLKGRFGLELRLVVLGGLRVTERAAVLGHRTWRMRPRLGPTDMPLLLWRTLRACPADTLAANRL